MNVTKSTLISTDNKIITLVNVFTIDRPNQQKLVTLLQVATEEVMRHLPGFVSANIHKSLDGQRVVNYAQWKTKEDFEAMLQNPKAQVHMEGANKLAIA